MMGSEGPAHDFAPAWLRIPSSGAGHSSSSSSSSVSSGYSGVGSNYSPESSLGTGLTPLSLRPQYLLKKSESNDSSFTDSGTNINQYQHHYHHHIQLEGLSTASTTSSRHRFVPRFKNPDDLQQQQQTAPPQQQQQLISSNRGPQSRHDFRNITNFHHSKSGREGQQQQLSTFKQQQQQNLRPITILKSGGGGRGRSGLKLKEDEGINFNTEFPSLLNENSSKPAAGIFGGLSGMSSAWDNANTTKRKLLTTIPKKKSGGFLETIDNGVRRSNGTKSPDILKVIGAVPASKKSSLGMGHGAKVAPAILSKVTTGRVPPTTSHSMEILKNPRTKGQLGGNKSEFLRRIRPEEGDDVDDVEEDGDDELNKNNNNNINKSNHNNNHKDGEKDKKQMIMREEKDEEEEILSRSLEEEERLLKAMGWKEDEDELLYAPLTEEEVKEFRELIMSRNDHKSIKNDLVQQVKMSCHNQNGLVRRKDGFLGKVENFDEDLVDSSTSSDDD